MVYDQCTRSPILNDQKLSFDPREIEKDINFYQIWPWATPGQTTSLMPICPVMLENFNT